MTPREAPAVGAAAEYRAAIADAVLADRSDLGRLVFTGKDALDLLHRLTTNDLLALRPGEGAAAAFLTPKGRLIDWVTFHRLEDRILALTGPDRSREVAAHVERYTFREEVRVEDRTRASGTLGICGARASARVAGLVGPEAAGRPRHHPVRVEIGGVPAVLARAFPLGGDAYHITAESAAIPALRETIRSTGLMAAGAECLEALRIEAGLPLAGREVTEEYNPWEARLDDSISLSKGCYVGQEVVARLHTYRKVSKYLVRLRLEGGVPSPGARLEGPGGEPAGSVTSAAAIPGEDRVVALGYVRDEDAVEGRVMAAVEGARRLRATVLGGAR